MRENTDHVLPFRLEKHDIAGRVVRLTNVAHDILARHEYPLPVAQVLGEALALAAMLGSLLKFSGRFSVHIKGEGPISMLLAEYNSDGGMRGLAHYDINYFTDGHSFDVDSPIALFGKGYLAMNIEQNDKKPYQGIIPLEGYTLSDIALDYFRRSEQLVSGLRLAARTGINHEWCVGGILIQQIAQAGGTSASARIAGEAISEDNWRRLKFLLQTVADNELLDITLPPPNLAYRLFHEDGVRIYQSRPLAFECNCTQLRVLNMLHSLPVADRDALAADQQIEVRCEFCNQSYVFAPDIIQIDKAH